MLRNKKQVAKMLRQAADSIEFGNCGMDDEEYIALGQMFTHRKLNIEQTCQYFNISRATLNRWQQCGKLPDFHKDSGGLCYLWMDEAEEAVSKWESTHP